MTNLCELVELIRNVWEDVDVFESLMLSADQCNSDPVVFDMLTKAYLGKGLVQESYKVFRKTVMHGLVRTLSQLIVF